MNEKVAEMLEQLMYLGANFQLTYMAQEEKPWILSVTCEGMDPLSIVSLPGELEWAATFAVNTVIEDTRPDEGIPLHPMP